jgi:hypothetical protein
LPELTGNIVGSNIVTIAARLPAEHQVIGQKLNVGPQAILKLLVCFIRCLRSGIGKRRGATNQNKSAHMISCSYC